MRDPHTRAGYWMLAGAFSFALMGVLTHAAGARCHWLVVAWARAGFMFLAMLTLARWAGVKLAFWKPRTLWIRSMAGSFSLVCNFYALTKMPVADALTLSHTYPIWIVVLSALVLKRTPAPWEWIAVACASVGVLLIEGPTFSTEAWPTVVALTSAFATSVAMLGLHRLRAIDARAIVAHFAGLAFVVSTLAVLLNRYVITQRLLDRQTLMLLAGVAVTGTIGQFCLTRAYSLGKPARLATIGLMQVVFALAFDIFLWGRVLSPVVILGFIMVLTPSAGLAGLAGVRVSHDEA